MKTLKKILFFTAGICLLIACSKSDQYLGDDSFGNSFKNGQKGSVNDFKYTPGKSYELTGLALYKTWKVGSGEVIQDVGLPCTAILEILENHDIIFTFTELPKPTIACFGKISESGVLSFKYPTPVAWGLNITDIIRMHTCATIWGEGINKGTLVFKGDFDGIRFNATAKFMARIDVPCPDGMLGGPIDGNLHYTFGYDLTVVE